MIRNCQRGVTLIEMVISVALLALLGMGAFQFSEMARKETAAVTEDLQVMIQRFGASKVLTRDLSSAALSFNYLQVADDDNLPFFVLAKNEFCQNTKCARKITLQIAEGQTKSKSIYFLTKRGIGSEMLKFTLHPDQTYNAANYAGMNWKHPDPDYSFTKSLRPESPWDKGRLIFLSSETEFYDCLTKTESITETSGCNLGCEPAGSCEYVVKRPMMLLGMVNNDTKDMTYVSPLGINLFKTKYRICRPDANQTCKGEVNLSGGLESTQTFYEKLPFVPGADNRTSFSPVELISYHLERQLPNSPDHTIKLVRTTANIVASKLVFNQPLILMTGIQSLVFVRSNISNPIIEYKLTKVRTRKSVK